MILCEIQENFFISRKYFSVSASLRRYYSNQVLKVTLHEVSLSKSSPNIHQIIIYYFFPAHPKVRPTALCQPSRSSVLRSLSISGSNLQSRDQLEMYILFAFPVTSSKPCQICRTKRCGFYAPRPVYRHIQYACLEFQQKIICTCALHPL